MTFDTSVLEAVLERKRVERETLRHETLDHLRAVLARLASRYRFEEVYVFGSVTRPYRFRVDSDVDIAVRGLPSAQYYSLVGELSLELGRAVDIVELETSSLAPKILREGIRLDT